MPRVTNRPPEETERSSYRPACPEGSEAEGREAKGDLPRYALGVSELTCCERERGPADSAAESLNT